MKLAATPEEARAKAEQILGMDIKGETVRKVLVAEAVDIAKEIYLGVILDRAAHKPLVMTSAEGGVEIEVTARENPDAIKRLHVDPLYGVHAFQARAVAGALSADAAVARQIAAVIEKLS